MIQTLNVPCMFQYGPGLVKSGEIESCGQSDAVGLDVTVAGVEQCGDVSGTSTYNHTVSPEDKPSLQHWEAVANERR
jgi:hypothetical protein